MQTQRIKSIKRLGIQNTLDLEVDHKDHNFYAEGIVTSNSHAYSYSSMCAATVYMKFKHPKEFYLCLLKLTKDEPNPLEEISKIQKELSYFNIKLLPPSITLSDLDFTIENNNIRFGLGSLKGISEKSIEKLLKFKTKYSNKFQIFSGANSAKIPINIFSSLVLSGGLDENLNNINMTRDRMLLEFISWNKLTTNEKKYCLELGEKYNYDLFTLIKDLNEKVKDHKGKPIIKDSRRLTIRKHISPYHQLFKQNSKNLEISQYCFESDIMGFCYSTTLKTIFSKFCNDLINIQEINQYSEGENVHFAAEVVEVKKGKSKEKKTPYFKILAKDESGIITVLMFDTSHHETIQICEEDNGKLPAEKDLIVVRGQKKGDCVFARNVSIQPVEIYKKISEIPKSAEISE